MTTSGPGRSALGNPLVQFFLAGAVIFGLSLALEDDAPAPAAEVTLTLAEQENLAALFEKTWRRAPTERELRGLIESRIAEELIYREALALGLDEGDVVVRRRLAQKMEFILEDLATRRPPTDEELSAFLAENADAYRLAPVLSFRQVFLSVERRGPALTEDAEVILAALADGTDPAALGDGISLPPEMERAPLGTVARTFGDDFAEEVSRIAPGEDWHGPLRSAYGAHLVRVNARQHGRMPSLAEAREALERDWRDAERRKARAAYVETLKRKYSVTIEQPEGNRP